MNSLGIVSVDAEKYADAESYFGQGLRLFEDLGDKNGIAHSRKGLGIVALEQGNYQDARACFQESLSIFEQIGENSGRAETLGQLGRLKLELLEEDASATLFEALQLALDVQATSLLLEILLTIAHLLLCHNNVKLAAVLLGLIENNPAGRASMRQHELTQLRENLTKTLSPEELKTAAARGASLDITKIVRMLPHITYHTEIS
jgi:tetratricopeptide (TPR) repeat protein